MALDAMESFESGTNGLYKGEFAKERKALRDRLAQPEPEPVAWMFQHNETGNVTFLDNLTMAKLFGEINVRWGAATPLYTAPVHASDISQERVDEMAKRKHEQKEKL